ncbi:MAG: carboxypeptidase M32 [Deltaproteobacteria bacterium]|nr:MAG: carboxypeptidase M32 [Deltaproteobacteria bacterium]
MNAYPELEQRFRRMLMLQSVEEVLDWDSSAMMPSGAAASRADQMALLRVLRHELMCAPELVDSLGEAEAQSDALDPWQQANLREMRHQWIHSASVPRELVDAMSRATSACEDRWREARGESDFDGMAPLLARVVELVRQVGEARAELLECTPYEALVDEHQPQLRLAEIDPLFDELATFLPGFLERVLESQAAAGEPLELTGPFAIEAQRALGMRLMQIVGFELDHGRLDVSAHPFCGGTPDDVRITTRYDEAHFTGSLMGVLHETGHALYQRGLPEAWRYQPVGEPRGITFHESQSLLIEMQACRSRPFLELAAPLIREAFSCDGPAWTADNLYRCYTRVKPGFIRVEADEVTYPAHVILRYRLEKALIGGELEVSDLPDAWQDGMKQLLGLTPPDHARGCLQDIHWFFGIFGYFPSYTMGAITAAQLYRSAVAQNPTIPSGIASGDFGPLVGWLRDKIHHAGCRWSPTELLERATGGPLDIAHYKAHLHERYLPG